MTYTLEKRTRQNIIKSLGMTEKQYDNADISDVELAIEKQIGRKLSVGRLGVTGRGSVYITQSRIFSMSDFLRKRANA